MTSAFTKLSKKLLKEEKSMKLKLNLMKARLHILENRGTECASIIKKLKRQIRNLESAIAAC